MEVVHRGLERTVAEVLVDQPEVDAGFEEVSRVATPQGMDRNRLLKLKLLDHPAQAQTS
jgi:hypothetical protein